MRSKSIVSLGLAAAMVVTLAVPGGNVEAAARAGEKNHIYQKETDREGGSEKEAEIKTEGDAEGGKEESALKNVTWKSSNKKVVKVNKKGVITGKKAGKATVHC